MIKPSFSKVIKTYEYDNNIIRSEHGRVGLERFNRGFKTIVYDDYKLEIID